MGALRWVAVVLLGLVGAVWIGQGVGLIGGSFMTRDVRWAWIGAACVAVAVVLAWQGVRASRH